MFIFESKMLIKLCSPEDFSKLQVAVALPEVLLAIFVLLAEHNCRSTAEQKTEEFENSCILQPFEYSWRLGPARRLRWMLLKK